MTPDQAMPLQRPARAEALPLKSVSSGAKKHTAGCQSLTLLPKTVSSGVIQSQQNLRLASYHLPPRPSSCDHLDKDITMPTRRYTMPCFPSGSARATEQIRAVQILSPTLNSSSPSVLSLPVVGDGPKHTRSSRSSIAPPAKFVLEPTGPGATSERPSLEIAREEYELGPQVQGELPTSTQLLLWQISTKYSRLPPRKRRSWIFLGQPGSHLQN